MQTRGKILIVEDFITERELWHHLFEREGFMVEQARDSILANKLIKKHSFDVIILDLSIPPAGREGGYRFLKKKLKVKLNLVTPVIIVTGIKTEDDVRKRVENRDDVLKILEKPVDNDILVSSVLSALGRGNL